METSSVSDICSRLREAVMAEPSNLRKGIIYEDEKGWSNTVFFVVPTREEILLTADKPDGITARQWDVYRETSRLTAEGLIDTLTKLFKAAPHYRRLPLCYRNAFGRSCRVNAIRAAEGDMILAYAEKAAGKKQSGKRGERKTAGRGRIH